MSVEARTKELGLALPAPLQIPPGVDVPLAMVKVIGNASSSPGMDRRKRMAQLRYRWDSSAQS